MLDKDDFDSFHKLIAEPMQKAMEAQERLMEEKLTGLGRSVDIIRNEQTAQLKHCQKTTREMLDFKAGTTIKVQNLEKETGRQEKRAWAIILAVITLGISVVVAKVFKL